MSSPQLSLISLTGVLKNLVRFPDGTWNASMLVDGVLHPIGGTPAMARGIAAGTAVHVVGHHQPDAGLGFGAWTDVCVIEAAPATRMEHVSPTDRMTLFEALTVTRRPNSTIDLPADLSLATMTDIAGLECPDRGGMSLLDAVLASPS